MNICQNRLQSSVRDITQIIPFWIKRSKKNSQNPEETLTYLFKHDYWPRVPAALHR